MEVSWPLSLCSQLRQCTNHSISFRLHTENQRYWLDLSKDEWIGGRKTCPARPLQRSCVLEKATFLHKAKWNNLCLVLNLTTHDVSEGLRVRGDSRHSVSAALYKWLPDVFVLTFFSWPPFQEMDWRSWQLIKNRLRVRKTNMHSAKLKSPSLRMLLAGYI